jgi:hypothetical protein
LFGDDAFHDFITKWQIDPEVAGDIFKIQRYLCEGLEYGNNQISPIIINYKGTFGIMSLATVTLKKGSTID